MVKNVAYAWRQMILYLSLSDEPGGTFIAGALEELQNTTPRVENALLKPLADLEATMDGRGPASTPLQGWTTGHHDLLKRLGYSARPLS